MEPPSPSSNVILGKYQLGRLLGRGSFAKVYYAVSLPEKFPVAVKVIDKRKTEALRLPAFEHRILCEIAAMRRLSKSASHPNILKIREVLATKSKIFLVMDLATGGDLLSRLLSGGRTPPEASARCYFRQLASAVGFCHANGVAHRDVKPQNLLLDGAGNLLVSDFGLAALAEGGQGGESLLRTACGTPAFAAPEVMRRADGGGYDGEKADAWSCGVVLFLLLTGTLPFDESSLVTRYKKMIRKEYKFPADCSVSKRAKSLVYALLDPNPITRMSVEAAVSHPWVKKSEQKSEQLSENLCLEGKKGMNAFEIISMSSGLDLSGLLETSGLERERTFTTGVRREVAEKRVVEVGGMLGYRVEREKGGSVVLVKGRVRLGAEIYEVAAEMVAVKVVVGGGGLEESEWDDLRVGFEKIGLVWHNDVSKS